MENRRNMQFVRRCAVCPTIEACKYSFGKYWVDKSSGGVGCNCPHPGFNQKKEEPIWPKMPRRPRKMTQQDLI